MTPEEARSFQGHLEGTKINRRQFVKAGGLIFAGGLPAFLAACGDSASASNPSIRPTVNVPFVPDEGDIHKTAVLPSPTAFTDRSTPTILVPNTATPVPTVENNPATLVAPADYKYYMNVESSLKVGLPASYVAGGMGDIQKMGREAQQAMLYGATAVDLPIYFYKPSNELSVCGKIGSRAAQYATVDEALANERDVLTNLLRTKKGTSYTFNDIETVKDAAPKGVNVVKRMITEVNYKAVGMLDNDLNFFAITTSFLRISKEKGNKICMYTTLTSPQDFKEGLSVSNTSLRTLEMR
jgi:hypothetical protein